MKRVRIFLPLILGLGLTFWGGSAFSAEMISSRKIVDVGCHNTDGTCFVTLEGNAFGSTLGCLIATGNQFRFDNGDAAIGKRSYASILGAFMSGKSVTVYLDGCTSQGWPKLMWFSVSN